jgi:hypothetical protein
MRLLPYASLPPGFSLCPDTKASLSVSPCELVFVLSVWHLSLSLSLSFIFSLKKRRLAQWSAATDEGKSVDRKLSAGGVAGGVPTPVIDPEKCRLFVGNSFCLLLRDICIFGRLQNGQT